MFTPKFETAALRKINYSANKINIHNSKQDC